MESGESVSSFAEKINADEASSEIRKQERHIRESADRGKIIVVVSATEAKPSSAANDKYKETIDDDFFDVSANSAAAAADGTADADDDKEKDVKEHCRIASESKLSRGNCETDEMIFPSALPPPPPPPPPPPLPPPTPPPPQQQQQRTRTNRSPRRESAGIPALLCIDGRFVDAAATGAKPKIPRPANAFMLFANEWRRKLAAENPRESNKDISVRLGIFWKNMSREVKEKYFALAREVDKEHKRKYPGMSCK